MARRPSSVQAGRQTARSRSGAGALCRTCPRPKTSRGTASAMPQRKFTIVLGRASFMLLPCVVASVSPPPCPPKPARKSPWPGSAITSPPSDRARADLGRATISFSHITFHASCHGFARTRYRRPSCTVFYRFDFFKMPVQPGERPKAEEQTIARRRADPPLNPNHQKAVLHQNTAVLPGIRRVRREIQSRNFGPLSRRWRVLSEQSAHPQGAFGARMP